MASPPTPVYSKSNPGGGASMSPRQKRVLIIICAVIAAATLAGSLWGALSSDQYGSSANGCVSINIPGSTGGELIHKCGNAAKALCRDAYAGNDPVSLAEQPQ